MDELTFEVLLAQHFDEGPAIVGGLRGDAAVAEEIAQDDFTRPLRRWWVVATHDRPSTWVYVVVVRAAG